MTNRLNAPASNPAGPDLETLRERLYQAAIGRVAQFTEALDENGIRATANALGVDIDVPAWHEPSRN